MVVDEDHRRRPLAEQAAEDIRWRHLAAYHPALAMFLQPQGAMARIEWDRDEMLHLLVEEARTEPAHDVSTRANGLSRCRNLGRCPPSKLKSREKAACLGRPNPGLPPELSVAATTQPKRTPARFEKRSEEHTSELQSRPHLVCRLLLEKKKYTTLHKKY